mmetsp:Transcript_32223/g.31531  ORF Transcript_32223/g.31531 Transcript_32223/m.31531 type:complete len:198 (+) Transcript_32223:1300-1893(+)
MEGKSPRPNCVEITKKLYEDAQRRNGSRDRKSQRQPARVKTSERSNQVYASRVLKQIERALQDLDLLETPSFSQEEFSDVLEYLGFSGQTLHERSKLINEAWSTLSGDLGGVSKRSFIIFVNVLNNLFLPWMGEGQGFKLRDEGEMQALHNRFFPFWEYKQKIKVSQPKEVFRSRDINTSQQFKPMINAKSEKMASS